MKKKVGIGIAVLGAVLFGVYLRFMRPWQLRWGATNEEVARTMAGDDVVKHPTFNATRAVTVQARPEEIWPWLVQIGGFCISPRNGVLVSGGYAKTPI